MQNYDKNINRSLALVISLFVIAIALSVLALAASAFSSGIIESGKATINKKTGATNVSVKVINDPSTLARVNRLTIRTKNIRFNSKTWPKTKVDADDINSYDGVAELNLPASAKVGSGRFDGIIQMPNESVLVGGELTFYNARLNQIVVEITTTSPIVNVHIYTMARIYNNGTVTVDVPTTSSLPPILYSMVVSNGDESGTRVILTSLVASIGTKTKTSTKKVHGKETKNYKSFITAKNKKKKGTVSVNAL